MDTAYLCYMISVYLKYSICKCFFFSIKNKTNFTASSLHSKQKGGEYPSVSFFPLNIYVVCSKALVGAWDKHGFGNLLMGSLRQGQDGRI